MGWGYIHPPTTHPYPHMLCGIGPHGPRTFSGDRSTFGWVSVGSFRGRLVVTWGSARVFWSPIHVLTLEPAQKLWFWAKPRPEMDSAPLPRHCATGPFVFWGVSPLLRLHAMAQQWRNSGALLRPPVPGARQVDCRGPPAKEAEDKGNKVGNQGVGLL